MVHELNVYALPRLVDPDDLAGGAVVIIDVLRASTTIAYALEAGAREVIPCAEVDEARAVARQFPTNEAVLGGERDGLPIEGFDLGTSPSEYTPDRVAGKAVVFTTTNGTRAMLHAHRADRVLIGGFVNVTAVLKELVNQQRIHLLCAGTRGQVGEEDLLLAGMLAERVGRLGGLIYEQNAQAIVARESWLSSFALPRSLGAEPLEPQRLVKELRTSLGSEQLISLGLDEDIAAAARIDHFHSVPEFDPEKSRIRLV